MGAPTTSPDTEQVLESASIKAIAAEVSWARETHPEFPTPEHGITILRDQLAELDAARSLGRGRGSIARKAAITLAAMAVRYADEICEPTA